MYSKSTGKILENFFSTTSFQAFVQSCFWQSDLIEGLTLRCYSIHFPCYVVLLIEKLLPRDIVICTKNFCGNFCKIRKKIIVPESSTACSFITTEAPKHVFSCEISEVFQNSFFTEHLAGEYFRKAGYNFFLTVLLCLKKKWL